MENNRKELLKTSIGGQAVLEGIMMRGPKKTALSCRLSDGSIKTEIWDTPGKKWYHKVPFIRGVFNFFESLKEGYSSLMKSAEMTGMLEEEESEFEKKLREKLGDKYNTVFEVIILVLAMALALGLFMFLPAWLVKLVQPYIQNPVLMTTIESGMKLTIFFVYLLVVAQMDDIKRTFMYHGAEHKCIFCYEHGERCVFDEHVWTSPENAAIMTEKIAEEMCRLSEENSDIFKKKAI